MMRRSRSLTRKKVYVFIAHLISGYRAVCFSGTKRFLCALQSKKIDEYNDLMKNKEHHLFDFQDICVLNHLYARVLDIEEKVYFIDE